MIELTKDNFYKLVPQRDNYKCVVCGTKYDFVHHIVDKKLFQNQGYYLDNGVSLCQQHSVLANQTILSCDELRRFANINNVILPEHLDTNEVYTRFGDIILPNNLRVKGELFFDDDVQKVLVEANLLSLYTKYVKYPRTYHLPFSENLQNDDRKIETLDYFKDQEIVVTEKMDGESATLYNDFYHARAIKIPDHNSQNHMKQFHAIIKNDIPEGWRICGENMYAKHSIYYNDLLSYFLGFSVWNNQNVCLNWKDTLDWFNLLNIVPVKTLYLGKFDLNVLLDLTKINSEKQEGYVVRLTKSFLYRDFKFCAAKFVRKNHVKTNKHWKTSQIIPNLLKKNI